MRHRAVQAFLEQAGDSIVRPAKFSSIGLTVMTALLLTLTASGAAANPDTLLAARTINQDSSPPPAALDPASLDATPELALFDPGDARLGAGSQEMVTPRVRHPKLAALLAVRSSGSGSSPEKTPDEALADAIALGPRPELEPKNPFRKRKLDLFRTVHPVSIGNADLLVRFRVRGNMREVMRLDVRF